MSAWVSEPPGYCGMIVDLSAESARDSRLYMANLEIAALVALCPSVTSPHFRQLCNAEAGGAKFFRRQFPRTVLYRIDFRGLHQWQHHSTSLAMFC